MVHEIEIVDKGLAVIAPGRELEEGSREIVQQLRDLCRDQVEKGRHLIVDFNDLNICPSLVWGNLLVLTKYAKISKRRIAICCLRPTLEKSVKIIGLPKKIDLFAKREEAIQTMQKEDGDE